MGKIIARNGSLYVEDSSNACQAMSALISSMTLTMSAESPDVTGFGEQDRQRLPNGLRDWSLAISGFWSFGASEVDAVFSGIGSGGSTLIYFGPGGSTTGCVMYSACAVLVDYNVELGGPNESANVSANFNARTGSMTRGTWA